MAKIAILHNSRGLHYVHRAWADSVNAIKIKDICPHTFNVPFLFRGLATLLNLFRIPPETDLLVCENGSNIITSMLWKKLNPHKKFVLIVSDPKLYYLSQRRDIISLFTRASLRSVDLFVTVSPLMASYIPENFKNICIVPTFRTPNFVSPHANIHSKNILFISRVCYEKGIDLLVAAFQKIQESFPDSKLYVVGQSDYIFGQGNLKKKIERKKLPGVIFTGWVPKLDDYLKNCSLYINLARIDPASVTVLEVMSCGIIPIISEGVGNKEIVKKISTDLVVRGPTAVPELVKKLWTSKELMERYSALAVAHSDDLTKANSIKLFRQAIQNLITQPAAASAKPSK